MIPRVLPALTTKNEKPSAAFQYRANVDAESPFSEPFVITTLLAFCVSTVKNPATVSSPPDWKTLLPHWILFGESDVILIAVRPWLGPHVGPPVSVPLF
jgi:hypothetical protein